VKAASVPAKLVFVGHATVAVDLDGTKLLTDPFLRRGLGPLRRHGPLAPRAALEGLDAILISHLHRDHTDLPSLRRLGDVPMIVPPGAGRFFERRGFRSVSELVVGQSAQVGAVKVTATQAVHDGERRGSPDAQAIGYLLCGKRRIYFAGDTDLFDGMGALGRVDLALLPIWGWGPKLGPGHMNPERAARAAALIEPRIVVPIHWGTLYPRFLHRLRPRPLSTPPLELARWMAELAPQAELRVLAAGESTTVE
jgi:L-ascorbate metabolism protein UlaG (beta-lactamase superfamily)